MTASVPCPKGYTMERSTRREPAGSPVIRVNR